MSCPNFFLNLGGCPWSSKNSIEVLLLPISCFLRCSTMFLSWVFEISLSAYCLYTNTTYCLLFRVVVGKRYWMFQFLNEVLSLRYLMLRFLMLLESLITLERHALCVMSSLVKFRGTAKYFSDLYGRDFDSFDCIVCIVKICNNLITFLCVFEVLVIW